MFMVEGLYLQNSLSNAMPQDSITHNSPLPVIIPSLLSNLSLPELICKCACTVIKETLPLQKRGILSRRSLPPLYLGISPKMRRSGHVRMIQADMYRSPKLLMHLRRWCSSQVIIIKDILHLRVSLIMVYMDFETLIKNSLSLGLLCLCANCRNSVCQQCASPDHFLHNSVMGTQKIRTAATSRLVFM